MINCFVRSVIELMNCNVSSAFKEALLGLDQLATHGYQIVLEPLCTLLFPKGHSSFSELVTQSPSCSPEENIDLCSVFTNFTAFQLQGLLYSTWWQCHLSSDVTKDENQNPVKEASLQCNIISIMYHASSVMLNDTYTQYFSLKERSTSLNEKLTSLKIKKRLKMHLASNKDRKKDNKKTSRKQSLETEAQNVLYELVDQVVNSFPTQEELEEQAIEHEIDVVNTALDKIPTSFKVRFSVSVNHLVSLFSLFWTFWQRFPTK